MKKIFLWIVFLNCLIGSANGQEWIRTYGQGLNAFAYSVIESYDRGFVFAAQINYGAYLWIFKTDVNGEILWDKKIGTGQLSLAFSPINIEQTADKGYIIGGTTTKYGSFDAFLLKLNSCAEIEWCKVLKTPNNFDEGFRIRQSPEGDYLLLGGYFATNPYSNISLFKFNSIGDLIWHQFYPLDSLYYDDQPQDMLVDSDGYLVTASRYYPDPGVTGSGIIRSYFMKTDSAGSKIWDLVYGANEYYYSWPWSTIKNQDGHYYNTCSHVGLSTGDNPAIIKVMHDGSQSYNHDIVNTGNYNLSGMGTINILNDTNFIMAGSWTLNNIQANVFIKTDTLGNLRQMKEIPHTSYSFMSTAKSFDNKFLSIANDAPGGSWKIIAIKVNSDLEYDSIYTQPFTYDSLCPYAITSNTVDPDCENVYVDIEEPFTNSETTKLKVFPNPASDKVTVEMPKYLVLKNTTSSIPSTTIYHQWKSVILEVYDIAGKKIMEREISKAETMVELDVLKWGKGMYAFRLVYNKSTVASEKVVVK